MFTLIKWITGGLLTFCMLIAVAVVVLPRVIDPNDYRDTVTELVQQQTNRKLLLQGNLSISVFPWLGVHTEKMSLSQPDEIAGGADLMLEVDSAQLRVKLLPLLQKRFEIDTVILERPRINFISLENGLNSLTGLTGDTNQQDAAQASDPEAAVALVVQGLEIKQGSLVWDDRQAGQYYTIEGLNISSGNLIGDSAANFTISGRVREQGDADWIAISSKGMAKINTDSLDVVAKEIELSVLQASQSLNLTMQDLLVDEALNLVANKLTFGIDIESDVPSSHMSTQGALEKLQFNAEAESAELTGIDANVTTQLSDQSDAELSLKLPNARYSLASQKFATNRISVDGVVAGRAIKVNLEDVQADLLAEQFSSAKLDLQSKDLKIDVQSLKATDIFDQAQGSGNISITPFDAAQLLSDFDVDYVTNDQTALRSVGLVAGFVAGLDSIKLNDMTLKVDQSQVIGSFAAANFEQPKLTFDLNLDSMDLDRYLPPSEESELTAQQSGNTAEALAVPMAMFNELNANGQFKAKQLISGGINLDDIDVQIDSSPGNVSITPKANLYEGKMGGEMVFKQTGETSKLHFKNQIDLVSLAKFLQAADVTDQLSGIGTLAIDVVVTEKNGVQSNTGTIKLFAKNGALKGVDIKEIVDSGYEQYKQIRGKESTDQEGKTQASDETRFAELIGTFDVKDFVISNRDFSLKAPLFRVSGQGDIDIRTETIDYLVNVSVVNSTDGQGGEALEKLKGISLPIRFSGSMFSPNYSLDMKALYKGLVKNEVEKRKSEFLEEELGIESEEPLSTKEILKRALLDRLNKKNRNSDSEEPITIEAPNSQTKSSQPKDSLPEEEEVYPQGTITIEAPNSSNRDNQGLEQVPDVYSDPNAEQNAQEVEDNRTNKEKREDKLKKLLLEGLFN